MKIANLALLCFVWCTASVAMLRGQDRVLYDAAGSPGCEDLLARLDGFAGHLASSSKLLNGQIVMFPGTDAIENAKYERYLKGYVVRRKRQDKLSVYVLPHLREGLRIELWSTPAGTVAPWKTEPLTRKLSITAKPILFDSDAFEMFFDRGKRIFVGVACNACCISNLDWSLLSELLDANDDLIPHIVIRGQPSRHVAIRSQLNREMREAGFDSRKVRYLFAKKNLLNSTHFSEVAVFLSPKIIRSANALRSDFDERN